jgi:hypothetical protein
MSWGYPVISADSHITEAHGTYVDNIDAAWKDKAPHIVATETHGDVFIIDGMDRPVALGLVAAAVSPPRRSASPACASTSCTAAVGIPRLGWPTRSAMVWRPR